jgi:transcriptional regulator with XRE-family HTH domain
MPHAVVSAMVAGATPLAAWREHLRLTQADVAANMAITQAAYAQMEAAKRPRTATLHKAAAALGVKFEQLCV